MNRSKYGAKKIVIDGITFDSKDEGRYYLYLKELKAKDKILNFERQPKYELQPSFKKYGKAHRAITYAPDFLIYHLDGSEELIDVKGTETQQGNMRRKMFDYKYPDLKLTWISRSLKYSSTGWIEYDELKKIRKGNKKCQK
ncbi:hypothetical protein NPD5_252 [Clostridium sporogenes]|uniref:Uncharacterized protein n=1 Tax=Clostridium sporogenes TaxID=1509 RepID=A0A1J1CWT8_CLOSG|nr:DUF1064 domain-containing protein [Clostridium sporogenes]APF27059.1 hypothetical protein NPD7_1239 [Clostridium sporogenes]APH16591.1 hypothetical protein NPD5_252 [Clostridium sporogenes]